MKNQVIIRNSDIILLPYSRVVGASGLLHLAIKYKVPVIISGSGALFEELEDNGAMVLWMVLWCYGAMVLWCYGAMVLWCYGAMVLWCYGASKKCSGLIQKNNRIN